MAGIERIKIISDWHDRNTRLSESGGLFADKVYYEQFAKIGMPLEDDKVKYIEVKKEDVKARYDYQEGIDIILKFKDGCKMTLQEKILDYFKDTATFEETKKNGDKGAWYYCTSQLYFICYLNSEKTGLRSGIMLNMVNMHMLSMIGKIKWNKRDTAMLNRGTSFRFVEFDKIKPDAVLFLY